MFSISNKNSLTEAEKFLETLKDHGKYNQVPVIAVGNKNDLEYARLVYHRFYLGTFLFLNMQGSKS